MNLVEATIDGDTVRFGQHRVPLDPERRPAPGSASRVVLGIRPESFEDAAFAGDAPKVEVTIEVLEELGSDSHVFFHIDAPRISAEVLEADEDEATLLVEEKTFFTARVDARTGARVGSPLQLAVDPARFHFFDAQTGDSLLPGRGAVERVAAGGEAPVAGAR
jgi:multiple sugar transport system ATP-binding protein